MAANASGSMLRYESFLLNLRKLCNLTGLPCITPHELRHSATELYLENGANTEDIRRLLNHSSVSTTLKYLHRTGSRLQNIADSLSLTSVHASKLRVVQ